MSSTRKMNTVVSARFDDIRHEAARRGKSAADVTEAMALAVEDAMNHEDQKASERLRGILDSESTPFKAEEFMKITQELPLAIHMGDPKPVANCPFKRDEVGIRADESDPEILVERTFAEWRVSAGTARDRVTVISYKAGWPKALYRNVVWGRSPDELPNGQPGRQNTGRHYIVSAEVTFFDAQKTFDFETYRDDEGFIRPELTNERQTDMSNPILRYLVDHPRERAGVRQPVDLLGLD